MCHSMMLQTKLKNVFVPLNITEPPKLFADIRVLLFTGRAPRQLLALAALLAAVAGQLLLRFLNDPTRETIWHTAFEAVVVPFAPLASKRSVRRKARSPVRCRDSMPEMLQVAST